MTSSALYGKKAEKLLAIVEFSGNIV